MSEDTQEMTPADIVDGLRANDVATRNAAMCALFGKDGGGGGAMLIRCQTLQSEVSVTELTDANRMFTMLLTLCQQCGRACGMHLGWIKEPEPNGIIKPGQFGGRLRG